MNDQELRQAWVRRIIDTREKGNKAAFGRKIGAESSYVGRMLYPPEKNGGKNIGEDMVKKIIAAYPKDPPPALTGAYEVAPERHAELRNEVLDMVLKSLVHAVTSTTPAAAGVFHAHLSALAGQASPRPLSVQKGILSEVLRIAEANRRSKVVASPAARRAGSGSRTK